MHINHLTIPEIIRLGALAKGKIGADWLDGLDAAINHLAHDWNLSIGQVLSGGTEALILEAKTSDDEHAVLKIAPPWSSSSERELKTLLAVKGNGYVQVKNYNMNRRALLLERLGPRLNQTPLSMDAQIEAICSTLKRAWMPLPQGLENIQNGAEKAEELVQITERLWKDLGKNLNRLCSEKTIEIAIHFGKMRSQSFDPRNAVLNHGDAHAWNTLAISNDDLSQFKFVDPDPVFAEPAYDLGIPMREWSAELLAGNPLKLGRERCARLASLTGVDTESIWQWGFLQRVSNGLLSFENPSLEEEGRKALAVADAWTDSLDL